MTDQTTSQIVARCEALYEDLHFTAAREWKEAEPGRKVIGYLPVYIPRELIHAAGMLPLGIMLTSRSSTAMLIIRVISAASHARLLNWVSPGDWILLTVCCFHQSAT